MNKTKIICTIGPASSDIKVMEDMVDAGMNVARLNLSHGTHETHSEYIQKLKTVREKKNVSLGLMFDLKGPEFRIKQFENGAVILAKGENFTLTSSNVVGSKDIVSITYKELPSLVDVGDKILLNDGFIELEVVGTTKYDILTRVIEGGELSNNKSINLPDLVVDMPYLNDVDKKDILFAIENDAEFLALSFVRCASDVKAVKRFIRENAGKDASIKLISKIESQMGVDNIVEIVEESDGVMIARGDLGVEVDMKMVPIYQKLITKKCNQAGKICIVATQMLESMIHSARPTRAELSDVANAVIDGASVLMLSGETAVGNNVVKTIQTMSDVISESEKNIVVKKDYDVATIDKTDFSKSISYACRSLSSQTETEAIIVVTLSGESAFEMSGLRPKAKIIACTPNEKTYHQMSMCWGTYAAKMGHFEDTDTLLNEAKKCALATKLVRKGDLIIQTGGLPLRATSQTNLLKVDIV